MHQRYRIIIDDVVVVVVVDDVLIHLLPFEPNNIPTGWFDFGDRKKNTKANGYQLSNNCKSQKEQEVTEIRAQILEK